MDKNSAITLGVIVLVVGIAMLIASPQMIFVENIQGGFRNLGMSRTTDVRGLFLAGGLLALVLGGVAIAVGLSMKQRPAVDPALGSIQIYFNGKQHGPYAMNQIIEWFESGKLKDTDLVRETGATEWSPVSRFLGKAPSEE